MRHPTCTFGSAVNDTPAAFDDSPVLDPLDSRKLRRARLAAGLTHTQLAFYVGVSDRAVRYWEAGKQPRIGSGVIERLVDALGVPVDELLED